jgi:hexosaminidase
VLNVGSRTIAALLVCGSLALPALSNAADDLMPVPTRATWAEGRLAIDAHFTVASAGAADPRIDASLGRLLARLRAKTGLALAPAGAKGARLAVRAQAASAAVQALGEDESYTLSVTPRGAELKAPTSLGIIRGLETFWQLVRGEKGAFYAPAVAIEDHPRFPWRGLMLDPCRRWEGLDVVKRTLDGMAAVKLNVFHWHLSDDQGFRIESKVFPKLQGSGSDGLFYTQEQVKDVIAYARDRGIRVVPEFDTPGHSSSWLVGYPELGAGPAPSSPVRTWGIFDNVLDPAKEPVYDFLDRFVGEMAALFPDAYFHIGGDEVTPRTWNANAADTDFMYAHKLTDANDFQAYFNTRMNPIVTHHGKRMVGWDEVLSPDLPKDIVVQSWRGAEALAEAASQGYDGMLSNGYYLDLSLPADSHYLSDPLPPGSTLPEALRKHVLGGEGCMWGEFVDPNTIDSRLWPRAAAIAERLWSAADVRDVEDMYRRLEIESGRLEAEGLQHRKNYLPMLARLAGGRDTAPLKVLADLVEPVKRYRRGEMRAYTSATPLDRLVDAARPESMAARAFRASVDRFLSGATPDDEVRKSLTTWRDNHAVLDPILAASPTGAEARSLSRHLSNLGTLGLEALGAVGAGKVPDAGWTAAATKTLKEARKAQAEVELAVGLPVRKLVLAAERWDNLKALAPTDRVPFLDKILKEEERPPREE